jgi:hypothetical protein
MARRPSAGRPPLLDDQIEATITAAIRAGAYAWVAAQAAGVSQTTFHRWMTDDRPRYRQFREKVDQARAQARLAAEIEVRKTKPEVWLRLGPGRERPGEPGWTDSMQHSGADGGPVQVQVAINRLVPRGEK